MDITPEGVVVGLFAIGVGLLFAFWGFRVFLILLPIWGFFAGFLLGANAMNAIFPDSGFLIEVTGWVIGFLLGLLFAVLSYLYYWVAVVLLGGILGYQLTYGVVHWLGFEGDGIIVFLLALAVGAGFAVGFFLLRMPAVLVIVASAISGAGATVAGVIVGLGLVPLSALDQGIYGVYQGHDVGLLWLIAAVALAVAGGYYQVRATEDLWERISADRYRNPGIDGGPSGTSAA